MPRRLLAPLTGAVASVAALALAGCGGSTPPASPSALLSQARAALDATAGVHFVLTSSGVPSTGTQILGGEGDLSRPDALRGTFRVLVSGIPATVPVVASNGAFYAQLPFASHYTRVDAAQLGLGDPGQLLSREHGVSALLTDAAGSARTGGQRRLDGEVVDVVSGTVPGSEMQVLPDANRSAPVHLTALISPGDHQLRQVTLTGPFDSAATETTYTVTLSHYGEKVTIAPPQT